MAADNRKESRFRGERPEQEFQEKVIHIGRVRRLLKADVISALRLLLSSVTERDVSAKVSASRLRSLTLSAKASTTLKRI